jgi:phage baseplate assembly protein W
MNGRDATNGFLGVGWVFPVCPEGGRIAMSEYERDVREAIRIILLTNRGERLMRPTFGASLVDFLFESIGTDTMERLRVRVAEALVDWEPRIDVLSVAVTADTSEPNKLSIEMRYRTRATNTQNNLVFPFYLEEGSAK